MDERPFIPRRPRHEVQPNALCSLTITFPSGLSYEAQLADLSRHGLKALGDDSLPVDTSVQVHANLPTGPLEISESAMIRWSRIQDDGRWSSGLIFSQELSWEVMGEMFLSGVLSIESQPTQA